MKRKLLLITAILILMFSLVGCGGKRGSKSTIFDEITLNETTFDEIHKMWDEKNLVYTEDEYSSGITVVDDFLGYDCYYRADRGYDDRNVVDYIRVNVLFHDDEEVKQGNSDITKYLEKKLIKGYEEGVKYREEDEVYYIYPVDSVIIDDIEYYVCIYLHKCYDQEIPEGYSPNYFELSCFDETKEYFERRYVEGDSMETVAVAEATAETATAEATAEIATMEATEEPTEVMAATNDSSVVNEAMLGHWVSSVREDGGSVDINIFYDSDEVFVANVIETREDGTTLELIFREDSEDISEYYYYENQVHFFDYGMWTSFILQDEYLLYGTGDLVTVCTRVSD